MRLPLEAVPNFSEGRDPAVIEAIGAALSAHADLLDVHADADHNRSVFTLVGEADALVAALLAGVACACERMNLSGICVRTPAPSPLAPSASVPPRCESRCNANSARCTTS